MTTADQSPAACVACQANRGEIAAPGGPLYEDAFWRLEHAFEPIPMVGWLVLKPWRHVAAVADLTSQEAAALGPLLLRISKAMTEVLQPAKVYVSQYGESVAHIHFHLIPRAHDLPEALRGPSIFALLNEAAATGVNGGDVAEAERVARAIKERLSDVPHVR